MLTYSFENIGKESIYEYLYKCIKKDIIEGRLVKGEHLPSKRTLAVNLGISTITVENSYGQLMSEGYIYSVPKKGYYVSDISGVARIKPVKYEVPEITAKKTGYKSDLSSNRTDPGSFPFATWAKLMRRVITDRQDDLMKISPGEGTWELRKAIARHLASFRDMQVTPGQIIIGAGTEYMYSLLIQLLGRDKVYCVEDPGYSKIARIYASNNVKFCYAGMDNEGMKPEAVRECMADIVHISPTHHYPTGITMPVSRRFELLAWANEKPDRYIIEDDYDSELRLNGQPIPALQSIDVSEKVIYINTFTKTLSSTVRISYMVLPEKLLDKFYKTLFFYSCTVSNFEQYTLAKFIDEGCFEKHINRMRKYYSDKRKKLFLAIKKSKLNKYVTVHEEDAGLQFLMEIKTKYSDEEFVRRAAKEGIKMSPLSGFYHLKENRTEHIFVMNYLGVEESNIEKTVEKLCKIIAIKK